MSRFSVWIQKLKSFNYGDLQFLNGACLMSIALVFTLFYWTQNRMAQDEAWAIRLLDELTYQREIAAQLKDLLSPMDSGPKGGSRVLDLNKIHDKYELLHVGQRRLNEDFRVALEYCRGRLCESLTLNSLPEARLQNPQQIWLATDKYQIALRDATTAGLSLIEKNARDTKAHGLLVYLTILSLLWMQATYVSRPAIRKIHQSLSVRSEFLSRISHEIRNPMNSILGMADILKGTRLSSEQSRYLDNLIKAGHDLLGMLNHLVDFSSVERGKLRLRSAPFELFVTLERCARLLAVQAHRKNLGFHVIVDRGVPNFVIGDEFRLEQVLVNLLGNALKFTVRGDFRLIIRYTAPNERATDDLVSIQFMVEDTGPGIPANQLPHIFESFYQGDSSIQRQHGGSGLGLTISQELIRLMGGQIDVESHEGQGSRFYFTIPFRRENSSSERAPRSLSDLVGHDYILIAEESTLQPYCLLFEALGAKLRCFSSIKDWKETFDQSWNKNIAEILIDDSIGIVSMIQVFNIAATQGLADRATVLHRSDSPVENLELLRANGVSRFRAKPLLPWTLLPSGISRPALPSSRAVDKSSDPTLVQQLRMRNPRLLLVDDSDDNLFLMKELLSSISNEIEFADNGLDAVHLFKRKTFDVVLMDIQMPKMDGYTAIRKMREIEQIEARIPIPIFAVTAHSGLVDAQKCREAGFNERIVKPLKRDELFGLIGQALAIQGENSEEGPSGLSAESLKKLLPIFLKIRHEDLNRLNQALLEEDAETAMRLGHKIKGSSGTYGFRKLESLGAQIEIAASTKNWKKCEHLYRRFEIILSEEEQSLL